LARPKDRVLWWDRLRRVILRRFRMARHARGDTLGCRRPLPGNRSDPQNARIHSSGLGREAEPPRSQRLQAFRLLIHASVSERNRNRVSGGRRGLARTRRTTIFPGSTPPRRYTTA
jgi:hypothetical protein